MDAIVDGIIALDYEWEMGDRTSPHHNSPTAG